MSKGTVLTALAQRMWWTLFKVEWVQRLPLRVALFEQFAQLATYL